MLSCLTLCNPMDYNLLGFAVYGIFQARMLEWVAIRPFGKIRTSLHKGPFAVVITLPAFSHALRIYLKASLLKRRAFRAALRCNLRCE